MEIDYKPQINPRAIRFLESIIRPEWKVFEWGSGQSTVFFARRVTLIASVEHDVTWVGLVNSLLGDFKLRVDYNYVEPKAFTGTRDPSDPMSYICGPYDTHGVVCEWEDYVTVIEKYSDGFFDLVFIDGGARLSCLFHSFKKVVPGGYILLDDSERSWYWKPIGCMFRTWEKREFMDRKGMARCLSKATFWRKPCSY